MLKKGVVNGEEGKVLYKIHLQSLLFQSGGNLVQIQRMVPAVQTDCQRQHQRRYRNRHHDAGEYQPAGNRIDIAYHRLDPIHHDRSLTSHDIAFFCKEQVNCGIHDIQSDYFLYQVLLQKQVGESDAEQDHGNRFPVIG